MLRGLKTEFQEILLQDGHSRRPHMGNLHRRAAVIIRNGRWQNLLLLGERRRSRVTGAITPTVRSVADITSESAGHGLATSAAVQIT